MPSKMLWYSGIKDDVYEGESIVQAGEIAAAKRGIPFSLFVNIAIRKELGLSPIDFAKIAQDKEERKRTAESRFREYQEEYRNKKRLRKRIKILEEAGISRDQIKMLAEHGVSIDEIWKSGTTSIKDAKETEKQREKDRMPVEKSSEELTAHASQP